MYRHKIVRRIATTYLWSHNEQQKMLVFYDTSVMLDASILHKLSWGKSYEITKSTCSKTIWPDHGMLQKRTVCNFWKISFIWIRGTVLFDFRILCLERIELYNTGDIFRRGDTMIKYLWLKKYYTRKLTIERTNVLWYYKHKMWK